MDAQIIQSGALVLAAQALAVGLVMQPALGVALSQGYAAAKACETVGRQPESRSVVLSTFLVGGAVSETSGIYGLLISMILMFVNPFFNQFLNWLSTM